MKTSQIHPKRWLILAVSLFALLVLAAACGSGDDDQIAAGDDTGEGSSDTSLSIAGSWELVALEVDGEPIAVPDPGLVMDIEAGNISGDAGCNSFSGQIDRSDDGSLTLGPLAQTEMACDILDFETQYMRALSGATRWEGTPAGIAFVSDTARMEYSQRLVAEPAVVPLAGTQWELNSIYGPGDGPARSVSSIDMSSPGVTMVIEGGTVTLSSENCTDTMFEVEYSEEKGGGSFAVNGGGGTECTGSEGENVNLDTAVSAVTSASGYMLDGERLTLLGEEGELVDFVAAG